MPCDSLGEEGATQDDQASSDIRTEQTIEKEKAASSTMVAVMMTASPVPTHRPSSRMLTSGASSSSSNNRHPAASHSDSLPTISSGVTTDQQPHCSSSASRSKLSHIPNHKDLRGSDDHPPHSSSLEKRTMPKVLGTLTTQQQKQRELTTIAKEERETHDVLNHLTSNNAGEEGAIATKKHNTSLEAPQHRAEAPSGEAVSTTESLVAAASASSSAVLPPVSTLPSTAQAVTSQPQKTQLQSQKEQRQPTTQDTAMCLADMGPRDTTSEQPVSSNNIKEAEEKSSPSKGKRKRSGSSGSSSKNGQSTGRWTQEEHQAFLEGLKECGREWKKVAMRIPTRSSAQIRSHAQKYFAKLQRDHETANHHLMVPGGLPPSTSLPSDSTAVMVTTGEGGLLTGSTIATADSSEAANLAPSIQRNVERIIANPHAAQQEVEHTLEALRERYRQLQLRLEHRRQRRLQRRRDGQDDSSSSVHHGHFPPPSGAALRQNVQHLSRKRVLESPRRSQHPDENSSVSSNVSSLAASRGNLGNDEILALQVLGGDLPRGDSSVEGDNGSIPAAVDVGEEASANHSTLGGNDSMDLDHPAEHEEAGVAQEAEAGNSLPNDGAQIDQNMQRSPQDA